jgi:hypothetical protein
MTARVAIAVTAALLALAAPAAAQVPKPADVTRVETAITELSKQKRAADGQVSARKRAAGNALAACKTRGTGWKRIRGVRDRAQRNAYARGAKALWADLHEVAEEGAWVEVYTPYFERFLHRFDTPLSDPVLQAGIDAQRKRLVFDQAA